MILNRYIITYLFTNDIFWMTMRNLQNSWKLTLRDQMNNCYSVTRNLI